jgi:hypothetical protein
MKTIFFEKQLAIPKNSSSFAIKISIFFALLAIVGTFVCGVVIMYLQYKYTYVYPSVEGEIVETTVNYNQIQSSELRPVSVSPHTVYKFVVDGKEYIGKKINIYKSFSYSNLDPDAATETADKFLEKYPIGSTVTVHYNPKNPEDAIIDAGFDLVGIGVTVAGLILMIVAVFVIVKMKGKQ